MEFKNFSDFYQFYLREHSNIMCRKLHFLGTCGVIALLHFVFEKNRPATFKHPYYSLLGDFRMFWDILAGRVRAF